MKGNLPNVQAQGAFVIDLTDGHELYARKADEVRPVASISKLAATLTAVDRGLRLDALTTITRSDVDVARGGARSRLFEGMTLSNRDLLYAALLGSDNRAVPALGRAVGLDPRQFAAAMTTKVQSLGLKHTRFVEPTGLSPQNVSTPREIVELLRAVMDHPVLGEVTRTVEYDAHPVGRATLRYSNTHRAAARANTHVLGGKTGFNNAARYCLVLGARVGGRTLGMAFLGTEGELTRFGDVARVADWVVAQEARQSAPRTMVASVPPGAARSSGPAPATAASDAPLPPSFGQLPAVAAPLPNLLPPSLPGVGAQLAPPALAPAAVPTGATLAP
jgi:D-alanyl-D-alanine endopeptidase (penicillin-binding protein 7)